MPAGSPALPRRRLATKFIFRFTGLLFVLLAVVTLAISQVVTKAFERQTEDRLDRGIQGVAGELKSLGKLIARELEALGKQETTLQVLPQLIAGETSPYQVGKSLLEGTSLDLLDVLDDTGKVLTSGHWEAHFNLEDSPDFFAWENFEKEPLVRWEQVNLDKWLTLQVARTLEVDGKQFILSGGIRLDGARMKRLEDLSGCQLLLTDGTASFLLVPAGFVPLASFKGLDGKKPQVEFNGKPQLARYIEPFPALKGADFIFGAMLPLDALHSLLWDLRILLLSIAAVSFLLAGAMSAFLARRITRPVAEVVKGVERLAAGSFETSINVKTNDELQVLVDAFNRMTREIQENEKKLLQAERLAAWRDVARAIAHEIKNPLFPIQLSIQTMQKAYDRNHPDFPTLFREGISTILEEVQRMNGIVTSFSQFARMPRPQLKQQSFNEVIEHAVKVLAGLPDSIVLQTSLTPGLPPLWLDREMMTQVLLNLLKNSVEAMGKGGAITVRTQVIGSAARPETVVLTLEDTGPGISPDIAEKIFRPYETTKEKGSGLGLAIAQKIILEHGGTLTASNRPEGGASFTIVLPIEPPEAIKAAKDEE